MRENVFCLFYFSMNDVQCLPFLCKFQHFLSMYRGINVYMFITGNPILSLFMHLLLGTRLVPYLGYCGW